MMMMRFTKKAVFTVLLMQSCFGQAELSETQDDSSIYESSTMEVSGTSLNPGDVQQIILTEFESYINYWAFNGSTAKDENIIAELLESAADLSESIGLGSREEIKGLMLKDALAQSGPNVILSQRTIPLIKEGIVKSQLGPLNRFLNSMSKANPKLSHIASQFTNFIQGKPFLVDANLAISRERRTQCLKTCALNFLGMQNNNTFLYMIKMKDNPSFGRQGLTDLTEIGRRFPSENSSSRQKIHKNGRFNPAVASTSDAQNGCYSSCMKEIWTHAVQGAGIGATLGASGGFAGVSSGAFAGAAVGAAVGTGVCNLGPECGKTRAREEKIKEKEMDLREKELALKERELRDKEKARRERQQSEDKAQKERKEFEEKVEKTKKEEIERKNSQAKREREENERKAIETLRKLEKNDWADRKKNNDSRDDSSVSCMATRTCDGSMTAFKVPDDVDQPNKKQVDPEEMLRHKREMNSMPASPYDIDSEHKTTLDLEEQIRRKREMTSMPNPLQDDENIDGEIAPRMFDNKPKDWEAPSVGKIPINNKDIASTTSARFR